MAIDWTTPPPPPQTLEEAYQLILVLWEENRVLQMKIAELEKDNRQLKEENRQLKEENRQLKEENRHLKERLSVNSSNSSKPPSSDPPGTPKPPAPSTTQSPKRKRGAQPGHQAHHRALLPLEEVAEVIPCVPARPCSCQEGFVETLEERYQVFEIPPIKPVVTEYQVYSLFCPCCNIKRWGVLPAGVKSVLGAGAIGIIGVLRGKYRQSKRLIVDILSDFFGLRVSLGTVSNSQEIVSQALKEPVEEAHAYARNQPMAGADETSFKQGCADGNNPQGKRAWMWVLVTPWVVVFMATLSRSQEAAKALLGENFSGFLTCDRWGAYNWLSDTLKQFCWSHLKRDFFKISQREGQSGEIGQGLLACQKDLFHYWHRVRDGTLKRSSFKVYAHFIRKRVRVWLEQGADYPTRKGDNSARAKTARTCQALLKQETALWTFVRVEGLEPTNNDSERAIRPFVIWRKGSYGTQSERGSRFMERIMTVTATCQQQGRNVLGYLRQAVEAHYQGEKAPSLLLSQEQVHQTERDLPLVA